MRLSFVLSAVAAAMTLASCGGGSDEAREKKMEAEAAKHGIDADVELDDKGEVKSVTINNGMGATVGKNLDLPEGFPNDVPIDSEWTVHAVGPAPGGYMVSAIAENASMDDVTASVRSSLTGKGWSESAGGAAMAQMSQLKFEKDGRISSYTLIDSGDGNVSVQLVTMKMPE